jgi:hypothetical protein
VYSPPAIGKAPIAEFKAAISFGGPANKLVPVSAIAWQPPWQKLLVPALTLNFYNIIRLKNSTKI